jgi:hypothetical protein
LNQCPQNKLSKIVSSKKYLPKNYAQMVTAAELQETTPKSSSLFAQSLINSSDFSRNNTTSMKFWLQIISFKILVLSLLLGILYSNPINPDTFKHNQTNSFQKAISNWDAGFYLGICDHGYATNNQTPSQILAKLSFFPGLPTVLCISKLIAKINFYNQVYIISSLLFVIFAYALDKYTKLKYTNRNLQKYVFWTYLIFPFSYFFHLPYTESLYMSLVFLGLVSIEQNNYGKSSFFGFLMGFVRVSAIPVGLLNLLKKILDSNKISAKQIIYFLPYTLGTLGFFTYLYFNFGDFFIYFRSLSTSYGRSFHADFIWRYFRELFYFKELFASSGAGLQRLLYIQLPFFLVLTSSTYLLKTKRYYELFYAWILWLIPLSTGLDSLNRYLLQSFPFIFAFSELCYSNRISRVFLPIVYIFGFLYTLVAFSYGLWVG